jgi:hypothetical protein
LFFLTCDRSGLRETQQEVKIFEVNEMPNLSLYFNVFDVAVMRTFDMGVTIDYLVYEGAIVG